MQKVSALLAKLFPKHDTGTAGFISALLLVSLLLTGIFLNNYFVRGNKYGDETLFNTGAVCVFLAAAGATYVFGKKKVE